MRIDCHCHIFNNDCIPVKGFLQSRFGVFVGKKTFDFIDGNRQNMLTQFLSDLGRRFHIDFESIISSLTDPSEKDNARYIMEHLNDFIPFVRAGMKDISEIVDTIKEQARDIDIWVPLMMDTESAYEGSLSLLSFEEQKRRTMEETVKGRGRIMPFFAYDPRSRSIDAVKAAIEDEGFIGIKLYPPLGFTPCDNEDPLVEGNLEKLYEYCSKGRDKPIPITAHCSWSDGVYSNRYVEGVSNYKAYYRDMANPSYWKKVLFKYNRLKLNLAHFGGAGEWDARTKSGPSGVHTQNWADTILFLLREYEHVYTDLSFHGILVRNEGEAYRKVLRDKISGVEGKVLLGSDWYMSRIQCNLYDYWHNFQAVFPDLFDMMAGQNPIRFLDSEAIRIFLPNFFSSRNETYDQAYIDAFR